VCGALPAALRAEGVDVRVLMPGYPAVLDGCGPAKRRRLTLLGKQASLAEAELPNGVPLLVLECAELYARPGGPYLSPDGHDWPDNALRFGVLSKAAAALAGAASPIAWRPEVVHCNDWPCGLAPAFVRFDGAPAATLMTVHNLAFQGLFDASWVGRLGLPPQSYAIDGVEFYGRMSFLKGGLSYADALSTVSPTYAKEIQTPELGCGLDGLLRHRSAALHGILNGIDDAAWNPASDAHLPACYDAASLERKAQNKAGLQAHFGLPVSKDEPLFGLVGRLTEQKGIDLVVSAADRLAALGQLVILGSGERALEAAVAGLGRRYPGRIAARIGFDEGLAHRIEAGADLFLMPSRFEPCGLNQMYSQRYGTPPIVRATGGLADTVEDNITGFVFGQPDVGELVEAAARAVRCYRDPKTWRAVQRAAMGRDFSWSAAARLYAGLYRALAALPR